MAYPYFNGYQYPYQNYQQQNNSVVWVSGEAGAKSFMVQPNQTVVLFDSEQNAIYLKSADASGMPSIKVLDYTVRDNTQRTPEIQPQSDFATKDDLLAIQKEIDAIKANFAERKNNGKPTVRTDESGK